ncbi:hypothetical protein K2X85_04935 [bacterium]|jgi:hypothetical protein|nr:hypothetical protein [bacterium]
MPRHEIKLLTPVSVGSPIISINQHHSLWDKEAGNDGESAGTDRRSDGMLV